MTTGNLFDNAPAQAHRETSVEAAAVLDAAWGPDGKPLVGTLRREVYTEIYNSPAGLTDDEIQTRLQMHPNTEVARRVELWRAGLVQPFGRRRTRSGRWANVWVIGRDPQAGNTPAARTRSRLEDCEAALEAVRRWADADLGGGALPPAAFDRRIRDLRAILRGVGK